MSERIKRYISSGQLVSHSVGDICKYADVAAIEAENARLRLVEDAADSMATALILFRPETMHSADVKRRALAAYDAAKAQETTK